MITREQAQEEGIPVDAPEMKDALMDGLRRVFIAARENAFSRPLHVTVMDEDGATLRQFSLTHSDRLIMGKTDDPTKLFVLPLMIYAMDADLNVARLRVPASLVEEPVEVNPPHGRN